MCPSTNHFAISASRCSALAPKKLNFLNFQALIKSAASPRTTARHADDGARLGSPGSWSLIFGLPGGCASSRLDHGLKVELFPKHAQNIRKTRAKHAQNMRKTRAKHSQNTPKSLKSGFEPKVKSPKMGLSITPRQCLQRPTLFRDIWPR